jgi:inner membrane protein
MTGPTHITIAIAATLALAGTTGQPPDALGWLALIVGSLAPDIDAEGTVTRPGALLGRLLPRWLARLLDGIGTMISRIIRAILGHRNATHWLIWAIVLMMLGFNLGKPWLWWFGWGYLWHIAGDFCTKNGVPLFGPIVTKDVKWSPIRTGSWAEWVISSALWGVIFFFGWAYVPPGVQNWVSHQFGYLKSLAGI